MASVKDGLNRTVPFLVHDYGQINIAAADFDPLTTLTDWRGALNISQAGSYRKNGFLVRPWTDGDFYAITWAQYEQAMKNPHGLTEAQVIATLIPQEYLARAGTWIEALLIKVFAHSNQTYPTVSVEINVGLIL